ncbi:MAG: hypothetical protein ACYC1D_15830 [Acidimicrobiales bacterium]
MSLGAELLEERRQRRRAGDPRVLSEGRGAPPLPHEDTIVGAAWDLIEEAAD